MKFILLADVNTGRRVHVPASEIVLVEHGTGPYANEGLTPARVILRGGDAFNIAVSAEDFVAELER